MPFLMFMAVCYLVGGFALVLSCNLDLTITGICSIFLGYIFLRLQRVVNRVESRNDKHY